MNIKVENLGKTASTRTGKGRDSMRKIELIQSQLATASRLWNQSFDAHPKPDESLR